MKSHHITICVVAVVVVSVTAPVIAINGPFTAPNTDCTWDSSQNHSLETSPNITITTLSGMPEKPFLVSDPNQTNVLRYKVTINMPNDVVSAKIFTRENYVIDQAINNTSVKSNSTVELIGSTGTFIIESDKSKQVNRTTRFTTYTPWQIYSEIPPLLITTESTCINTNLNPSIINMNASEGTITHVGGLYYKIPSTERFQTSTIRTNTTAVAIIKPSNLKLVHSSMTRIERQIRTRIQNTKGHPQELVVYIVPPLKSNGGMYMPLSQNKGFIWVESDVRPSKQGNVLAHELVHSTQTYRTNSELQWFHEASAQYLATSPNGTNNLSQVNYRVGTDYTQQYQSLSGSPILSEPSTWVELTPYRQGGLVLYKLDQKLKQNPHTNLTVRKLHYWMIEQDGLVTYQEFRKKIKSETNKQTVEWLDTHVHKPVPPIINPTT